MKSPLRWGVPSAGGVRDAGGVPEVWGVSSFLPHPSMIIHWGLLRAEGDREHNVKMYDTGNTDTTTANMI